MRCCWDGGGGGGRGGGRRWLGLKVVECYRSRRGRYEVIIREHKSGAGNVPLFHPGSGGAAAACVRGYQATGPILADRLRGKRRQSGREGREEGGKEVGGWGELPRRRRRRRRRGVAGVDLLNAK